jgi:hypothetical protein
MDILFIPCDFHGYPVYALLFSWISCLCPVVFMDILFIPCGFHGYPVYTLWFSGYPVYALWFSWISCLCPVVFMPQKTFNLLGFQDLFGFERA